MKTILKIPGGSGNQLTSFLKKIGLASADGSPSDLYKRFRNPSTSGKAAADALRIGYGPLYTRNEYMHQLPDDKLRGLIIEETGHSDDSAVAGLVLASIKAIKKFAKWSDGDTPPASTEAEAVLPAQIPKQTVPESGPQRGEVRRIGLNLSYTVNLNLPATSDIAVFNAIFKALKDNMLKGTDEQD